MEDSLAGWKNDGGYDWMGEAGISREEPMKNIQGQHWGMSPFPPIRLKL